MGVTEGNARLDQSTVLKAYHRWAPIYDFVFGKSFVGALFETGRKAAVATLNRTEGRLLELGVGTGLSLPLYAPHLAVTGIDLSPDMLAVARRTVAEKRLGNVEALIEMDAGALDFPDASFDTVAVMYVITVVPHPRQVMDEVARVLKPGGTAVVVGHFAAESGPRAAFETLIAPLTEKLGWRPDFDPSIVTGHPAFETAGIERLKPFGLFTLARLTRKA